MYAKLTMWLRTGVCSFTIWMNVYVNSFLALEQDKTKHSCSYGAYVIVKHIQMHKNCMLEDVKYCVCKKTGQWMELGKIL